MNEFNVEALVAQFQKAFETSDDPMLWVTLIEEETAELNEALDGTDPEQLLKESADLAYVLAGFLIVTEGVWEPSQEEAARVGIAVDAAKEAMSVACYITTYDAREEAFKRVHASNMSKLGDDGKPIRREDGKVLKGPNYKAPDLSDLV